MPYSRYSRGYSRKRVYRKRASTRLRSSKVTSRRYGVPRPVSNRYRKVSTLRTKWKNPVSQTALYKVRYTDTDFQLALSTITGSCNEHVFRMNSLYDPDQSGIGVQPYGYDELTPGLFQAYQVYASKIKVNFYGYNESDPLPRLRAWIIPFRLNSILGVSLDPSDWMQLPYKRLCCWDYQDGTKGNQISNYIVHHKFVPELKGANQVTEASAFNTDPTTTFYWVVLFDTQQFPQDATVNFDVSITYYSRFMRNTVTNES